MTAFDASSNSSAPLNGSVYKEKHPYFFATGIAYLSCAALGSVLNLSVIIYLLSNFKKMIYNRSSGILMLSLAVGDLFYVTLALLYAIQHITENFVIYGFFSCLLPGVDLALMHVNIWTTFGICVQRLTAIKWPFDYAQIFSRQRCLLIILGVWASSGIVGIPLGVLYEYKEIPIEYRKSEEPVYGCTFRGEKYSTIQFFVTNMLIYAADFLIPAVLVTKYYWEFSKEVRRRAGSTTNTGGGGGGSPTRNGATPSSPNGIKSNNLHPERIRPASQSSSGVKEAAHALNSQEVANDQIQVSPSGQFLSSSSIEHSNDHSQNMTPTKHNNVTESTLNNKITMHCTTTNGAINSSRNNINSTNENINNNYNNNNVHNSGSNQSSSLAHKFLQLYASVVSISCWVCFTPFYNLKFIQSVDSVTGFHILLWIRPTGVGTYIERTCTALTHLNSIINPILFIGLKLYMKWSRNQRVQSANRKTSVPLQQKKSSSSARRKKSSGLPLNDQNANMDSAALLREETNAISNSVNEVINSFHVQSEQTET